MLLPISSFHLYQIINSLTTQFFSIIKFYTIVREQTVHFIYRLSSTTEYPWKKTRRFPIRALSLLCSPIILMYALLGENGIIENYNARIQLLILQEEIQKSTVSIYKYTEISNW